MLQAQIYIDLDDLYGSVPLYEFILDFLKERFIIGATAFKGIAGFGERSNLNRPKELFSFDETPLMITFCDTEEKVKSALTELRETVGRGFIVTHHIEIWK